MPCTCGGVPLSRSGVDVFAGGVAQLLRPGAGVAVFDQEGGWPFGLETLLREAAPRHGLTLHTRRGPFLTNVNYALSAAPLDDDVASDPLQRTARALDAALLLFPAAVLLALVKDDARAPVGQKRAPLAPPPPPPPPPPRVARAPSRRQT